MDKQELLDIALDYIKTETGKKTIGINLDINQLKTVTSTSKSPETRRALTDKLKEYVPEIKKFNIQGRIYDKITSKPLEGVKVEPLLALGKKTFTDKNGEFSIDIETVILPFNNKGLVQSKLVYTVSNYIPQTSELLTQKREVKSDLKAIPLVNVKLAAEQATDELKQQVYNKLEEANDFALSLPEKILIVRRKQIEKLTNAILFKLLPLGIGLLLVFGITKIKDRNKKVCPTPTQLKRAISKRNSITKQLNQIYLSIILNVGLAVLFNKLAILLSGIRLQITNLPFPTAVPPGIGVPQSLLSNLQNVKDLLKELSEENKKLNIQLIIALIFFVAAIIIIAMILKTVDSLIFECARDEKVDLEELNSDLLALTEDTQDNVETTNSLNGFTIEVIQVDKNAVGNYKRKQAVGKNSQGIILVRGDESFSASDKILINELAFYIRSNDLKAY